MPSCHYRFKDKIARILLDEKGKPFNDPVYLDGYTTHDRLLEGVIFKCTLDSDGLGVTVEPKPEDMGYLGNLNLGKLLQEIAMAFPSMDVLDKDSRGSSVTGDDIVLVPRKGAKTQQTPSPVEIKIIRGSDLIAELGSRIKTKP